MNNRLNRGVFVPHRCRSSSDGGMTHNLSNLTVKQLSHRLYGSSEKVRDDAMDPSPASNTVVDICMGADGSPDALNSPKTGTSSGSCEWRHRFASMAGKACERSG